MSYKAEVNPNKQKDYREGENSDKSPNFWRQYLGIYVVLTIPEDGIEIPLSDVQ